MENNQLKRTVSDCDGQNNNQNVPEKVDSSIEYGKSENKPVEQESSLHESKKLKTEDNDSIENNENNKEMNTDKVTSQEKPVKTFFGVPVSQISKSNFSGGITQFSSSSSFKPITSNGIFSSSKTGFGALNALKPTSSPFSSLSNTIKKDSSVSTLGSITNNSPIPIKSTIGTPSTIKSPLNPISSITTTSNTDIHCSESTNTTNQESNSKEDDPKNETILCHYRIKLYRLRDNHYNDCGTGPLEIIHIKKNNEKDCVLCTVGRESTNGGKSYMTLLSEYLFKEIRYEKQTSKIIRITFYHEQPITYLFKTTTDKECENLYTDIQKAINTLDSK
ncbi:hypothetical protein WA158_002231 [Blastocystis sp. Blastoise]